MDPKTPPLQTKVYKKSSASNPGNDKDLIAKKRYKFRTFVFRPDDVDSWYQIVIPPSEDDIDDEEKRFTCVNHKGYTVQVSDNKSELFEWLCRHFQPTHIPHTEDEEKVEASQPEPQETSEDEDTF